MSNLCIGYFCEKTGLTGSDYKFWASKNACDIWFQGKRKGDFRFEEYSYLREGLAQDSGVIHVPYKLDDLLNVDYIAFKNNHSERWLYGKINNHEFINETSTKLYFDTDYLASYWDCIDWENLHGYINRIHVTDDWIHHKNGTNSGWSADKYYLDEPIQITTFRNYNLSGLVDDANNNLFSNIRTVNEKITKNSVICLVSDRLRDGGIGSISLKYQAGGSVGGYIYTGGETYIVNIINEYVRLSQSIISQWTPYLKNVKSIYIGPKEILENESKTPIDLGEFKLAVFGRPTFNGAFNYWIKHAKTLNYIQYELVGNSGSVILNSLEHGTKDENSLIKFISGKVFGTGGPEGNITIRVVPNSKDTVNIPAPVNEVSTYPWASLNVAGTMTEIYALKNPNSLATRYKRLYEEMKNEANR